MSDPTDTPPSTAAPTGEAVKPADNPPADNPPADNPPADAAPEAAKPADEAPPPAPAPAEVVKPADEAALSETAPVEAVKPADEAAPAEATSAEVVKPADESVPAEVVKPADESAPAEVVKPAEAAPAAPEPAPAEAVKPAAEAPAAEPAPKVTVHIAGATDVGRIREHNEDNYLLADLTRATRGDTVSGSFTVGEAGLLFAVCDGMGGALAGEVASQMAVDVVHGIVQDGGAARDRDHFAQKLVASVQEAGARIFLAAKTNRDQHGMGTTATVAGVHGSTLFVGQVGDSRAYLLRRGKLKQITKDQSLAAKLIEAGQLTEEQAETYEHAHIILQALGTADTVSVDLCYVDLRKDDVVMLCSDGLSGLASFDQIREAMATLPDPLACCQRLIDDANEAGGHDNITVIVARFDGELPPCDDEDATVGYQPFVLSQSVEAMVAGRAGTSLKIPDLPPPGADVKRAQSLPPGTEESIAALFDPIDGDSAAPAKEPGLRAPRGGADEPLRVPMQSTGGMMGWVLVVGVLAGVLVAAYLLLRPAEPIAAPPTRTVTVEADTRATPAAPAEAPPAPDWGDANAAAQPDAAPPSGSATP